MKLKTDSKHNKTYDPAEIAIELPKEDSIFHQIIVACLRWKQLNRGAHSRIIANSTKRKNTSIAIEEVKQGLVIFNTIEGEIYEEQA